MKKRYWLRGGVIALVINTLVTIALYSLQQYENSRAIDNSDLASVFLFYISLFLIPVTFIFGSIVGWLIGTTKK
jgi:ABC-type Co2+ transport system permease subunit